MKRPLAHQIDHLAQCFFGDKIPPTWSYNEQHHDYGKDYLVELGDEDGEQTGLNFFVQLKGQEAVQFTGDGGKVKFPLEAMHAAYYADKIKDLPVFLVVVDVTKKRGWFHFLQPDLETDRSWRKQKSVTIHLPAENDLADTAKLRQAVENAKRMMRLLHPESIQDAVAAKKRRVLAIDPRFDVRVSLVDETPVFQFSALEPVSVEIEFKGGKKAETKVSDLLDKGVLVEFKPGEVKITGSPLFEQFEKTGVAIQSVMESPATVTLVCRDAEGHEVGRLTDVPGQRKGGRKESRFEGGLVSSPLSIKLGPMGQDVGGSAKVQLNLTNWDGQNLLHLAFFDKLLDFSKALAASATTDFECQVHGNRFFSVSVRTDPGGFAKPLSEFLTVIDKGRKVARHFGVNPTWTFKAFDADSQETAQELHAIFFEGGLVQRMPNVSLSLTCPRKTFNSGLMAKAKGLVPVSIASDWVYTLLGEKIEVGKLTHEYTAVQLSEKKSRNKRVGKQRSNRVVEIALTGSQETVRTIRPGDLPEQSP
jgi:hypothetical protein